MIEVFVKRPVTTLMLVSFFVMMGLVAVLSLNIEKDPKVDFPIVSVQIIYPGATPSEIETQVIRLVEDAVSEVSEIKKVNAQAFENMALVRIEFNIEADVNIKLLEVKDKVEAIVNDLPSSIEKPVISKVDVLAQPVMILTLSSDKHSQKDLYEFADLTLKGQLSSVSGVATVDIIGGDIREIRVELDSELMKQEFITINDVINGLSRANVNVSGGEVVQKGTAINVKFNSEFTSIDDIKKLLFTTSEGKRFTLQDIAVVYDGVADRELSATYNGKDTVLLSLKNAPDGNAVAISEAINKKLPKIRDNILLDGMKVEVANDSSIYINRETIDTVKNILLGMLLTVIIILIFTASLSSTLITSLIIPISLIATMFMISTAKFTINSMTLLALATVLGTLIANAIIIIESALTKLANGATPEEAAIDGTKQVVLPVFASSGTNLAVFIPIAFMGGIAGKFMIQFGLTVVFATIISIIISFTLTPMLIAKLMKNTVKKSIFVRAADAFNGFIISNYYTVFKFIWRFKIIGFVLTIAIMVSAISLVKYLGIEMSPTSDTDELTISIVTPEGSTIDKTYEHTGIIDERIRKHKEVLSTIAKVGENGVTNATLTVNLLPLKDRSISDLELAVLITDEIADIPDIDVMVNRGKSTKGDITINVFGKDYDKMIAYSKDITEAMYSINVFRGVRSSYREPKNERIIIPDQNKLNIYGVNNAQIANAIRASIYGDTSNRYKENGQTYDINVLLTENSRNNALVFENIFVTSTKGLLPISELGAIKEVPALSDLLRRDKIRIIEIQGVLGKSSLGKVQLLLDNKLKEINFEEGYGYYYAGNSETSSEVNSEMAKAFLLAIILTYMVLAAVLNSFIHPFTIALSIITSFAGVFVMMFLTDATINIGSMLAMIMLIGLSVNNSILVVEYAIAKIKEGETIKDAIWSGLSEKMRTIMMTSIAIILGMVPQMFSSDLIKSSMGSVVIGGMLGSILFALIFTPIAFYFLEKVRTFSIIKTVKRLAGK